MTGVPPLRLSKANPHRSYRLYRGAIDNFKYPEDNEYEAYLEPAIEQMLAGKPIARPEVPSFGCAIQSVYYTIPRPLKNLPKV